MFSKVYVIFVAVVFISLCRPSEENAEKCTSSDPRKIFDSCVLDYRYMSLWCDSTNFTCIPSPETIESQAPCSRAVALYMNDSCVGYLDPEILRKYISLQQLYFSDNLVTKISNETFSTTEHLVELDISKNLISEIDTDSFAAVERLHVLNMKKNRLSTIRGGVFRKLINLKDLYLDDNQLTEIDVSWFPHETKLQKLELPGNRIYSWIEPQSGQFPDLRVINLERNKILSLTPENFANLPALRDIRLGKNIIMKIFEGTFDGSPMLHFIDLSDNLIEALPKNLFDNLCQLRSLRLSGNTLITVQPDWFINIARHNIHSNNLVTPLSVNDNQWTCDCNMFNYWEFLHELEEESDYENLSESLDIECELPLAFYKSSLKSLTRNQILSSGDCPSLFATNGSEILRGGSAGPIYMRLKPKCAERKVGYNVIVDEEATTASKVEESETVEDVTITLTVLFVVLGLITFAGITATCCIRYRDKKSKSKLKKYSLESNRNEEALIDKKTTNNENIA